MKSIRTENKTVTAVASIVLALASAASTGCIAGADAPEAGEDIASAAQATTSNQLTRGQQLTPGSSLRSSDGRLFLLMQDDGNLVLYFQPFGTWTQPLWASNTAGHPGAWAVMQGDGNFVVYSAGGSALWATATGPNGSFITVQGDGNLVVYNAGGSPLWSSNTAPNVPPTSMCINAPKYNTYFCPAGSWWRSCQTPSYNPYAAFQNGDSNVIVYCADKGNGWTDNELNPAGTYVIQTCWNNNGTLVCTPSDPYGPLPRD